MSAIDAILSLEDHHCRFPYGQGSQITFCRQKRKRGPYCAMHAEKCFTRDSEADAALDADVSAQAVTERHQLEAAL